MKRMEEIENGPPIPHPIISCTIPLPQIEEVSSLQVFPSFPIIETPIASPPIQKVIPLKAHGPYKVTAVRILSPLIQEVVSLKAFPSRKITTTTVPSQETPVQQVKKLWIGPPMKIVSSPVSPRTKLITDLSFFWNPKVEDSNEITSSLAFLQPKPDSELSFFWVPEETNEITTKNAPEITKFTTLKAKPIITFKVPSPPIQRVIPVHTLVPNRITEVRISSPPVQHVTSVHVVTPNHITETRITSLPIQNLSTLSPVSPTSIASTSVTLPTPMDLIYFGIYLVSSPSRSKENHRRSARKTKVSTSSPTKPQFSGSCVNKSRQLRRKVRFTGSGWKKKRGPRQSLPKESPQKSPRPTKESSLESLRSVKGSIHKKKPSPKLHPFAKVPTRETSWKSWKKKSVRFGIASWKRRKKKSILHLQSSSPREVCEWKRSTAKWLFYIFNWDPDITSLLSSLWNPAFFSGRECTNAWPPRNQWNIFKATLILLTVKCIVHYNVILL